MSSPEQRPQASPKCLPRHTRTCRDGLAFARLKVVSPIGIPDNFDLAYEGAPVRHCRVVWRKPDQIGVAFE
jgi:hypothetical protein